MKICTKCNKTKHESAFTLNNRAPSGLGSWCRLCANKAVTHRLTGTGKGQSYADKMMKYLNYQPYQGDIE